MGNLAVISCRWCNGAVQVVRLPAKCGHCGAPGTFEAPEVNRAAGSDTAPHSAPNRQGAAVGFVVGVLIVLGVLFGLGKL